MAKKKDIKYEHKQATDDGAKELIKKLANHPMGLISAGTGGGKTFMAIRAIERLRHNAHIFVVTTKKQLDSNDWQASIDSYNKEVPESHLTYSVYNYESLNSKKKQPEIVKELNQHANQPLFIVADEAHKIKNPTSISFKHVRKMTKLKNCVRLICLTATPISESLLDGCSYLILAGYYKNKSDFLRQHVTRWNDYNSPIIKDYNGEIHNEWLKDYEKIIDRVNSIQVNVDTKHLLPTIKYEELTFEYDKTLQKEYRKIQKDYRDGVYESIAAANAAQRDFLAEHANQRKAALSKIINNPKRPQGPILIFYQYNSELDSLKEYLPKAHPDYQIYEINGAHNYDMSKAPEDKSLFLCQYIAAGEALNAQWSHVTVFYAPTYSWEKYKQARGRNTRAYQGGTTYHIRFVVKKTINEHYWYDLIDNKKKFTENLAKQFLKD